MSNWQQEEGKKREEKKRKKARMMQEYRMKRKKLYLVADVTVFYLWGTSECLKKKHISYLELFDLEIRCEVSTPIFQPQL